MKKRIILVCIAIMFGIIFIIVLKPKEEYFDIIFKSEICSNNINNFFEDSKYIYYLNCHSKEDVIIKFNKTNIEMNIKEALESGKITIEDLKGKIDYYKESKND